jgi:integrase
MAVYKRGIKWEIRLQIKGQKYYRQVPEAQNKAQALVAEAQLRKEIYEGRYGRDGQEIGATDFVKFCKEVFLPIALERLKSPDFVNNTVRTFCQHFRGRRLKDITPMLIEGFKRQRLTSISRHGRKRHPATVKNEITVLSRIFGMAIDNDLIGLNPCRKVRWAKGQTVCKRERVLTYEEEKRLMQELERYPEAKAATIIALNTGLRRTEILNIHRSQLNEAAHTLRFVGKGDKARMIPLNQTAWATLETLAGESDDRGGYLFQRRAGHNLSGRRAAFHLALERAGIEGFRFHDLRHTFSSRVRQHTDAFTVRDLMGHTDVKTTDIYVTASLEEMREAVESLERKENVLRFKAK